MKKILNIGLILLITFSCYAQKNTFKGFVKDATTLNAIKDVNIYIEGTLTGTTTNDSGFFSLTSDYKKLDLIITHVSYKKLRYTVSSNNLTTEILLLPQINNLKEFTVNSDPIISITKKLPVYVIDYLLVENKILLLVYQNKKISDPRLLLIDQQATILLEKKIDKADELFIDCFDDMYFLNKEKAVKIEIKPEEILLSASINRNDFDAYNKAIDFKINDNIFFHTFHYQSLIMKLHCINLFDEENEQRTLLSLVDSSKIDIFESEYDFFYYAKKAKFLGLSVTSVYKNLDLLRSYQPLDWVDTHGRFSPVKATILKMNEKICIFNTIMNTIELYNAEGHILNKTSAKFISDKNFSGKLIQDEKANKIFAVYKEKSNIQLREVDVLSGELKQQISIPDFPFIEHIKIAGNQVYFLYKKNINEELKQLYGMQI